MRIALVHSFYQSAVPSGENTAVTLQAQAIADAGNEVRVVGRFTDDFLKQKAYPLKAAFTIATGKGPSPLKELEEFLPDVIHVHNLFPNWSTDWLRKIDVPIVVTIHNFRLICAAGTLLRDGKSCDLCPALGAHHSVIHSCYRESKVATLPLAVAQSRKKKPEILEQASEIIFLSKRAHDVFAQFGLGYEDKASVIPSFVTRSDVKKRLLSGSEVGPWLFAGRISTEKGILPLIEQWPGNQPLDVVGGGPLLEKCRELAGDKAIVFHGQQSKDFVMGLISKSRGLIFPSVCQEMLPFIYLEALSAGCPVVALEGNTVADDVQASGSGVVFAGFSEIAGALDALEDGIEAYRRQASARWKERFSIDKWQESITDLYRRACLRG